MFRCIFFSNTTIVEYISWLLLCTGGQEQWSYGAYINYSLTVIIWLHLLHTMMAIRGEHYRTANQMIQSHNLNEFKSSYTYTLSKYQHDIVLKVKPFWVTIKPKVEQFQYNYCTWKTLNTPRSINIIILRYDSNNFKFFVYIYFDISKGCFWWSPCLYINFQFESSVETPHNTLNADEWYEVPLPFKWLSKIKKQWFLNKHIEFAFASYW